MSKPTNDFRWKFHEHNYTISKPYKADATRAQAPHLNKDLSNMKFRSYVLGITPITH